jgi:hypothetical protein
MEKVGSQIRENIEDTGYTIDVIEGDELTGRNVLLVTADNNKLELWTENNDFAGYVIVIDGIGYEFVRTIRGYENVR